ncbi:DUF2892 domain-containing protein [Flavobacteriaceae bacterium]|nr:DUF2892 domain-containing protein [Flavobacteriaceae bacterium]MDA7808075.1 DUF2892 domain-containing protein [Flavobacteriaceae bacterium]MDA8877676.1 DUF2892 domain-containing protein [Flavobacteriaceae bacterium]MDA9588202.1 DUF2892 domain-containing protein [Flavobacteriaceae bacterium]MDC0386323.1 DUF2892 domain-containing protein [Flavobacteriaceae bacterium]
MYGKLISKSQNFKGTSNPKTGAWVIENGFFIETEGWDLIYNLILYILEVLFNHKSIKMNVARNIMKVRAHDAICGILYLISVGLTLQTGNLDFLYIALAVGVLQIISPFTKFCPVYFTLNKLMKNTDPIQNGK